MESVVIGKVSCVSKHHTIKAQSMEGSTKCHLLSTF